MNAGSLLPLLLLAVFFYALILRPAQRRQRAAAAVAASVEPGAAVVTTAGMHATVHAVDDKTVDLEIAPGVVVRFAKGAIAKVVSAEVDGAEANSGGAHDSSDSQDEPRNTTET